MLGSGSGLLAYPSSLYRSLGKAFSIHRPQGGRHTQARMWGIQLLMTGLEAGLQGGAWKGALEKLGPQGACQLVSWQGDPRPPQPLLVAVGHRTQVPTFSFLPRTDGHSNEEDLCGGAVGEHHSRGRKTVF